jgi:hypothetical protein
VVAEGADDDKSQVFKGLSEGRLSCYSQFSGMSALCDLWVLLHRARTRLRACLEASWFAPEVRP